MFTIVIETGITIETGIFIGTVILPEINNLITQDGDWIVTQDDNALVTE